MQFGGCTRPTTAVEPFPGAIFQYLAANVVLEATNETSCRAYEIRKIDNAKIAFIGLTLEGTPTIVTPTGVAGLKFRDEVETTNALVREAPNENGVRAFVVLLHQGGFQNPPAPGLPGTRTRRLHGRQPLRQLRRGRDHRRSPTGSTRRSTSSSAAHTHAPYICKIDGKLVTSASSFGRVVTDIDLVIDHQTKDVKSATAERDRHAGPSRRIRR